MISPLKGILMLDELPNARLAVYIFLEMIALGFALEAVAALVRGDDWWKWTGALVMGIVFMVLGVKSPQIVKRCSQYLNSRLVWMAAFVVFSLYSLYFSQRLATPETIMNLHQRLHGASGYAVVGLIGAVLSCGVWWLTGRMLVPASSPRVFYITDPKQREEIERALKNVYQAKAAFLESPQLYQARAARDEYRKTTEDIETKVGCLIDLATVECLPKPPEVIDRTELEIHISTAAVADEIAKSRFWVVRKTDRFRFRVPIVLFLSMTNHGEEPVKVDLVYLESKSPEGGWADIRMADSFRPIQPFLAMEGSPLVMETTGSYGQMKGEYLLPLLYNRLIQPGRTVDGWVIAEYPKGVKYGDLIGDMRVSVLDSNKHWVSSKTFPTHPPMYPTEDAGPIVEGSVIEPLDFFINED